MRNRLLQACHTISEDLATENPALQHVLENDHLLQDKLTAFSEGLSGSQKEAFLSLEHELTLARRYARMAALRLARKEDDKLEEKLDAFKELAKKSEDYDRAVVGIERSARAHLDVSQMSSSLSLCGRSLRMSTSSNWVV